LDVCLGSVSASLMQMKAARVVVMMFKCSRLRGCYVRNMVGAGPCSCEAVEQQSAATWWSSSLLQAATCLVEGCPPGVGVCCTSAFRGMSALHAWLCSSSCTVHSVACLASPCQQL
jgi:hypothetical protein